MSMARALGLGFALATSTCPTTHGAGSHGGAGPFRFSNVHGNGMVLQMAPQRAQVWGFTTLGDEVTITIVDSADTGLTGLSGAVPVQIKANTSVYLGNSTWAALLPPMTNSLANANAANGMLATTYTITATSKLTRASSSITGVVFGARHLL